jgi:hypothetical protein
MELTILTSQKNLLILKGPYSPDQQTAITELLAPSNVTVMFIGNEQVDSMDALVIQLTPTATVNVNPSA